MRDFPAQELHFFNRRLDIALWLGAVITPFFAVLDYVVVRPWFNRFLMYRIACAVMLAILLFLHKQGVGKKRPFVIAQLAASGAVQYGK